MNWEASTIPPQRLVSGSSHGNPGTIIGVSPTGELRVALKLTETTTEICLKPGTISLGYHDQVVGSMEKANSTGISTRD